MINGPTDQRTPPMTPQLALRVAIVGGLALVMFALIFFRLWFLQVLDTSHYDALAQTNVVRAIPIAAPRGDIEDSSGTILAGSKPVPAVLISPESLPVPVSLDVAHAGALAKQPAADYALYDKLASLLRMSTKRKTCTYYVYLSSGVQKYQPKLAPIPCLVAQGVASSEYANVTIKSDVSPDIQDYIAERQTQFPGVLSTQVFQRTYPLGNVAAQVLGTLGQLDRSQVGQKEFPGLLQGSVVGQNGLENEYNQYLQGNAGEERVKVNSENQFEGYANETQPTQGDTLKTSLDAKLEQVGQSALAQSIKRNPTATGGSFVAMDPQTGAVYAMGSLPTYNPNIFTHPISTKTYEQDFGPNSGSPQVNRAIDGAIPDGSTFKVITATAALETGDWRLDDTFSDVPKFCVSGLCLQNSGGATYGSNDLQTAIEVSDDEFFYNLGLLLNNKPVATQDHAAGGALQQWASRFGIGHTTGIDLPGEASGQIASPGLLKLRYQEELECQNATGPYAYTDNATGQISATKKPGFTHSKKIADCGIANASYWTEGDNIETGVGQFDDQVTAAQLAVVYAAIENGGTIVTPHIGEAIESPTTGQVIDAIADPAKRTLNINSSYLDAIRQGLELAANGPSGTSTDVMGGFPKTVYGKTGTAELGNLSTSLEDAWYACYVPASETSKPIVVVVNVEKGGFGAVAAAPVAREILSQWFLGNPGQYVAGTSKDT